MFDTSESRPPPPPPRPLDRRCDVCGSDAAWWGFDYFPERGRHGVWFCSAHRAEGQRRFPT